MVRVLADGRTRFRAFLRRYVPTDTDADDLLQHAMLKAIRHGQDWDAKENAIAWFYRILRNVLTDYYRSRAAEGRKIEALSRLPEESEVVQPLEKEKLCECFNSLLPALKPEYAELIKRIDLGEEASEAVAEELGISYNNLSVRLHRARLALKAGMEKACGLCTEHGCLDCSCRPSRHTN